MFRLALLLPFLLFSPSQAVPRDAAAAEHRRTAIIRGRITDRETGRPIIRALVTLSSEAEAQEAVTDADGRYRFTGLPAGRYVVEAGTGPLRATHLTQSFGASRPRTSNRVGPAFSLEDGQVRDADVALSRALAIAGRVVGPDGEPLANLTVTARALRGGAITSALTDDRGAFRVFGLVPGSYRVCADAQGFRAPSADPADERYVRTCAPGVVAEAEAEVIVLAEDATPDIGITLQRRRTYSVSGVVVDAAGMSVTSGRVSIASLDHQERTASDDVEQGQFTVRGIGPGRYAVTASVSMPAVPGAGARPAREYEAGATIVQIDSADAAGIVVALSKAATITGRVLFDTDGGRPPAGGSLRVLARSTDRVMAQFEMTSGEPLARVNDDFTFSLSGLFGPHVLTTVGAPAGWVVKAIRYQGRDILDVPVDFAARTAPARLEVVLTDRGADLSARVVDAAGRPTTDCLVAIVPADRTRWEAFRHGWWPSQPAPDDVLRVGRYPPGEYLIGALDDDDYNWLSRDPDALEAFARVAQPVTLAEREKRTIDLRVVRLDGGQR